MAVGELFHPLDGADFKRRKLAAETVDGRLICIGFRRWKAYNLKPLLASVYGRVLFVPSVARARALTLGPEDSLVIWGRATPGGLLALVNETGCQLLHMEDGFVRSVGLGSDLIPPLSLVIDAHGIYFDPSTPSALERLLNSTALSEEELRRAQTVRAFITRHGISKYNIEPHLHAAKWPAGARQIILVPGQVEDDASVRYGSPDISTNLDLLRAVRAVHPESFIVYKPHPDVLSGNRAGRRALSAASTIADHIERHLSVVSCIASADEVHTMTSQAGFDALLHGKRVVTYGTPFYAGWGLTEDRARRSPALERRTRALTLNELTAITLLRYPLYWDPVTARQTDCETVLLWVMTRRNELEANDTLRHLRQGAWRRLWRKLSVLLCAAFTKI